VISRVGEACGAAIERDRLRLADFILFTCALCVAQSRTRRREPSHPGRVGTHAHLHAYEA